MIRRLGAYTLLFVVGFAGWFGVFYVLTNERLLVGAAIGVTVGALVLLVVQCIAVLLPRRDREVDDNVRLLAKPIEIARRRRLR